MATIGVVSARYSLLKHMNAPPRGMLCPKTSLAKINGWIVIN